MRSSGPDGQPPRKAGANQLARGGICSEGNSKWSEVADDGTKNPPHVRRA
ncbi:MAG: hypothetical protein WAU02_00310 [Candidatus Saccharimonadales bacterium]